MVVGIFSHWSLVFWVLKANSWHAQGNCPTLSQIKRHYISWCLIYTPPKTNIEPENHPVEKETHLPYLHFLGSMLVFRGVHNTCINEQFHFGMAHMIFAPFLNEQEPWFDQWLSSLKSGLSKAALQNPPTFLSGLLQIGWFFPIHKFILYIIIWSKLKVNHDCFAEVKFYN